MADPPRADRLDEADRAYVERVRAAAARLGVREEGPDPARDALADIEDLLPIDIDPPASSSRPPVRMVKSTVKRLVRWYLGYVSTQVTAIGEATLRLGATLSDRVDDLDSVGRAHAARLAALEERVERLEGGTGQGR